MSVRSSYYRNETFTSIDYSYLRIVLRGTCTIETILSSIESAGSEWPRDANLRPVDVLPTSNTHLATLDMTRPRLGGKPGIADQPTARHTELARHSLLNTPPRAASQGHGPSTAYFETTIWYLLLSLFARHSGSDSCGCRGEQ